jgi:thymidylate kinase
MKKYACIGTHGVGKTTLSFLLASELKRRGENIYLLQEKVRKSPFPINGKMEAETALWACTSHIEEELNAQAKGFSVLISDRSPYDTFIYSTYFGLSHPLLKCLKECALNWLSTYDKIFWVRGDMPLKGDGIRSEDLKFQQQIDLLFNEFLNETNLIKDIIWTSRIYHNESCHSLAGSLLS